MTTLTVYQRPPVFQRRVAGLGGRMPEVGKIKIGAVGAERPTKSGDGTWRPPVKLPYFRVTTLRRGEDGNFMLDEAVHAVLGDKPTEIPIKLLSNDPDVNQVSRRAYYKGRTHLFCQGDGERAWRQERPDSQQVERACPCEYAAPGGPCKINGIFRCLIDISGIPSLGGVYVFRTTGRHSVENLYTGMDMILAATRGRLANIPLALGLTVKTMTFRENGQAKTTNFPMVYVRYAGTLTELLNTSLAIATAESSYANNLRMLEHRMETAAPGEVLPEDPDEQEAIVEEFYPEANSGVDVVDAETGEVLEDTQPQEKPKRHRRTKAEMEAARRAEAEAEEAARRRHAEHATTSMGPPPDFDRGEPRAEPPTTNAGRPVEAGNGGAQGHQPPPEGDDSDSDAEQDDDDIPGLAI